MDDGLARYAVSVVPLGILAAAAIALTVRRGAVPGRGGAMARLLTWYGAGVFVQVLHFLEERSAGFAEAFPALFGFGPFSDAFFTGFNVAWITIWIVAAVGVAAGWRIAYFPVWFLALAACVNGIAHPLMAIATGAYFPGLWTALFLGAVGAVLLRILLRDTPRPAADNS